MFAFISGQISASSLPTPTAIGAVYLFIYMWAYWLVSMITEKVKNGFG